MGTPRRSLNHTPSECLCIRLQNTDQRTREKLLLSWIAPRGVVAASMASLFAISLQNKETPIGDPLLMEAFVYSVICSTV